MRFPVTSSKAAPTHSRRGPTIRNFWRRGGPLYGYKYEDRAPEHVKELIAAREKVMREQGDNFPSWVLDRLGIEYMLANRIAMGRGLNPPRFRWVPFDDALMSPLNPDSLADNPDKKAFYEQEAKHSEDLSVAGAAVSFARIAG